MRYDRELMKKTLVVMKRVKEIKEKRERQFYVNRMKSNVQKEKADNVREIERNLDLLVAPAARNTPQIQKATAAIKRMQKAKETEEEDAAGDDSGSDAGDMDDE